MKRTLYTYFTDRNQIAQPDATRVLGPIVAMPIHKKDDNDSLYNMLPEVVVTAKYPHEQRVIDTMNASNAEFMRRLRNNDKRAIHNQDGSYSTHVLGSADNMVFPAIQDVNGELKDYRGLPWQRTLDKAIQNNDYIEFPTEGDARYFGEHYKKYFPEFFSPFGDNQYADGGEMNAPKHWEELSMADKSDAIASAVRNGVTTLEDIRKAWNDYADSSYQEETHEYLKGGYKPSASIKNRIANWEGSSMQTNRSFAAEAKDFWNAIPSNVRSKLSQQQADALYSYSYNVGAGNFKKRVVPSLERYFNGNGSVEDVQRHMYATKDKDLRGLAKRRTVERAMFGGQRVEDVPSFDYDYSSNSSPYGHRFTVNNNFQTAGYLGPIVNGTNEGSNNSSTNKLNVFIQALEDEPKQTIAESTPEPRYNALERLQNIYSMYGMDDYANEIGKYNPFEGLMFADGGKKSTNTKGVTSSNGQYHVNPADYWAVLGSEENNKPVEVTLPEVAVKAADPKNYMSSFHSEDIFPFINVATAGLLNRGSVTQDARLLKDTYDAIAGNKALKDVVNSAILGNEGIFSNPYINFGVDLAIPLAASQISKIPTYRNLEKIGYTGVPHNEILLKNGSKTIQKVDDFGNPVFMDEDFPNTNSTHTIWTSDDPDYGITFADYSTKPKHSSEGKGKLFDVYVNPKELNLLDTPKPFSSQNNFDWNLLPYKFEGNKVKYADRLSFRVDNTMAKSREAALKYRTSSGYSKSAWPTTIHKDGEELVIDPRYIIGNIKTDDVVDFSKKNGYDGVLFHNIYDGPIEINGTVYDYPINETILNPGVNSYVLPHGASKLNLLRNLPSTKYYSPAILWSNFNSSTRK